MEQRGIPFLAGLLMGLIATGLLLLFIGKPRRYPIKLLPPPSPGPITIHIAGAVENPGVYELPQDSITQNAIEVAGGPAQGALLDRINLAAPLVDGQQIYVPQEDDYPSSSSGSTIAPPPSASERININTASAPELESLPGIGPAIAAKIVDYRELHGLFNTPEDLLAVSGIGSTKLEQIIDLITFR